MYSYSIQGKYISMSTLLNQHCVKEANLWSKNKTTQLLNVLILYIHATPLFPSIPSEIVPRLIEEYTPS